MKIFAITSTEARGNAQDMFLMDEAGNYYGVWQHSYARFHKFPKSIEFWKNSTCADADRYFNVTEVEITESELNEFDNLVKEYDRLDAAQPSFSSAYPVRECFKTKKDYLKAADEYVAAYEKWVKDSHVADYITEKNAIWEKKEKMFYSFVEA